MTIFIVLEDVGWLEGCNVNSPWDLGILIFLLLFLLGNDCTTLCTDLCSS